MKVRPAILSKASNTRDATFCDCDETVLIETFRYDVRSKPDDHVLNVQHAKSHVSSQLTLADAHGPEGMFFEEKEWERAC